MTDTFTVLDSASIVGEMDAVLDLVTTRLTAAEEQVLEAEAGLQQARELVADLVAHAEKIRAARSVLDGDDAPAASVSKKSDRPVRRRPKPSKQAPKASPAGQHRCLCRFLAKSGTGLAAHMRHCDVANATTKPPAPPPAKKTTPKGAVVCDVCNEVFDYRADLAKHRRARGHWTKARS
jgi:hypothetical protein